MCANLGDLGQMGTIRGMSGRYIHSNIHIGISQININVNPWYLYTYNEYINIFLNGMKFAT